MASVYVGNLPLSANEATVRDLFAPHCSVELVSVILDHETGKPRGFGYVQMPDGDAGRAIAALNGEKFDGLVLKVSVAVDRRSGQVTHIADWRGR